MEYPEQDLEKLIKDADSKIGILVLTRADDAAGKPIYVYLSVFPSKYAEYIEAHLEARPIIFEDFGTVLKTGPGYPPPKVIMQEMEEKHGFNHNFEQEFAEAFLLQSEKMKLPQSHSERVGKRRKNYPYAKPEGGGGEWESWRVGEKRETDNT